MNAAGGMHRNSTEETPTFSRGLRFRPERLAGGDKVPRNAVWAQTVIASVAFAVFPSLGSGVGQLRP
jgi:hypothetical protein